jgi:hypothetical protein
MRIFSLLSLSLLLLTACSGKSKKTPASFSLSIGRIVSGGNLNGGVILKGSGPDGHQFTFATMNAGSLTIDLPNGTWAFEAMGWSNPTNGPMTGQNYCGSSGSLSLSEETSSVPINMNMANCQSSIFTDSDSFTISNNGTFKDLTFESCLTLAGVSGGDTCDNSSMDSKQGFTSFFKVAIVSSGSIPLPGGSLISNCIQPDVFSGSLDDSSRFTTGLKLPTKANSGTSFPVELRMYEKSNCPSAEQEHSYFFPNGFGGAPGSGTHSFLHDNGSSETIIYWADNYLGLPDSAFRVTNTILPTISCSSGACITSATEYLSDFPKDSVRGTVWDLLGTIDGFEPHDDNLIEAQASGSLSLNNGSTITGDSGSNLGKDFNMTIRLVHAGPSCSISITTNGDGPNHHTMSFCNNNNTNGLVSHLNSSFTSHTFTASASSSLTVSEDNKEIRIKGGALLNKNKRHHGVLPEIKNMLLGVVGTLLHHNGLLNIDDVCNSSGTFSRSFIGKNGSSESITLSLSNGSVIYPAHMSPAFSADTTFDKRVEFALNGRTEQAFEFNCTSAAAGNNELGNGWYRNSHISDGNTEETEVFYATQTGSAAQSIEMFRYDDRNAETKKSWTFFHKTDNNNYKIYQIYANPIEDEYSREASHTHIVPPFKTDLMAIHNTTGPNSETDFLTSSGADIAGPAICFDTNSLDFTTSCTAATVLSPNGVDASDIFEGQLGMGSNFSTNFVNGLVPSSFTAIEN